MAEQDQTLEKQAGVETTADKIIDEGQKIGSTLVSWEHYLNDQYINACKISKENTIYTIQKAEELGFKGYKEIVNQYVSQIINHHFYITGNCS